MSKILEIHGLSKKFRIFHERKPYLTFRESILSLFSDNDINKENFWALKDISFSLNAGDSLGIIGKNGAGKSTLLKILSKITPPTEGYVIARGRVASLLEVGTGFHPELTGRENIFLNGSVLGMKRQEIKKRFDEIVDFSGVVQFLDTPLKHYSSGMQMRLAFSVAAFLEPEILIIDEVLAVGDAEFQKKCLGKMDEVSQSGRTILFVSHNMAAVTQLCKSVVWLDEGKIVEIGTSQSIVPKYISGIVTNVFERKWDVSEAPGDDKIKLLECYILQDNKIQGTIDINQEFQIHMKFQVLKAVKNLISGVKFYTVDGICLNDSADWRPNLLNPGIYHKFMTIPPQTFAEGNFNLTLQLVFWEPNIRSVYEKNILSFHAYDSDHPDAVRGLYKEAWEGLMRIGFKWNNMSQSKF